MALNRRNVGGALTIVVCLTILGGLLVHRAIEGREVRFCKASLPIREIDGRTLAVQDRDPAGTGCDLDETNRGMDTLGIDCKVRASDGTVLATVRSTRVDGTCGTDSPAP